MLLKFIIFMFSATIFEVISTKSIRNFVLKLSFFKSLVKTSNVLSFKKLPDYQRITVLKIHLALSISIAKS